MLRYLSESKNYKVYSIYENVYLKDKRSSKNLNDFDKNDKFITSHCGDPDYALILQNEEYVIISGCGISVYNIKLKSENHILDEVDNVTWTEGLHQSSADNQNVEIRFVSHNRSNQLRVFKMNIESLETEELN